MTSTANQEIKPFQSEVKQLLHLMIHSLYSNKEIFLRELIANAVDAAEKRRFLALSQPDCCPSETRLCIKILVDKAHRTLTVRDNGIGMTRDEVIKNLGTIAKSGTKAFLEAVRDQTTSQKAREHIIGQFGVGFYSAFMVADKVVLRTRAATVPADQSVYWESTGAGEYLIKDDVKHEPGTEVVLYLRSDQDRLLDPWHLRRLITQYANYVHLPIEMEALADESKQASEDAEGRRWVQINAVEALWRQNRQSLDEAAYVAFYQQISKDPEPPLTWTHQRVEGKQEYTLLLYVPQKAPWDFWHRDTYSGLSLYVQRVFIMSAGSEFLPHYLRFVTGVVESNDLPLNVSRELLQENRVTKILRQACTKRTLHMLEHLATAEPEKYQKFWSAFGMALKEGAVEDRTHRDTILKLLRFYSTHGNTEEPTVSLLDYCQRMPSNQTCIYYLIADQYEAAKHSPHLEWFQKEGVEVLLLCDRIDAWLMSQLEEFEGKKFESITRSDLALPGLTQDLKPTLHDAAEKQRLETFVERVQTYLKDRVQKVKLSQRLEQSPALLTTAEAAVSTQMAKLLTTLGQKTPKPIYHLELNPKHPVIQKAASVVDETQAKEWIELIMEQALLVEQGGLENLRPFIERMNRLLVATETPFGAGGVQPVDKPTPSVSEHPQAHQEHNNQCAP